MNINPHLISLTELFAKSSPSFDGPIGAGCFDRFPKRKAIKDRVS
jgi:hypothetical protein